MHRQMQVLRKRSGAGRFGQRFMLVSLSGGHLAVLMCCLFKVHSSMFDDNEIKISLGITHG